MSKTVEVNSFDMQSYFEKRQNVWVSMDSTQMAGDPVSKVQKSILEERSA